uniref:HAT C-terminal dimerisation domain-containing protein n=1 Tax=Lactuca sativa TaxID=4236 RepID=A0A9R1UEG4_LACSA|nr:hypothetical protein LSAT_V11C900478650 [Lactuca sativa]
MASLTSYMKRPPVEWWDNIGDEVPEVKAFATKIFGLTSLQEKRPFTTLIARRKWLRRRANACQGRPCHKDRRRAFARRLETTRIYDAHLRHAFTTRDYDTQCVSRKALS